MCHKACEWMIWLTNTAPWGIPRPSQKPKDGQRNNLWRTTSSIRQTRSRKWKHSAKNYSRRQQEKICRWTGRTWAVRAALVAHDNHRGQEEELLLMLRDKMNIARNCPNQKRRDILWKRWSGVKHLPNVASSQKYAKSRTPSSTNEFRRANRQQAKVQFLIIWPQILEIALWI